MTDFEIRMRTVCGPDTALRIKNSAHEIHSAVNQLYDRALPYGFHLDMVAENVARFSGPMISDADLAAVWFGAYFHDSIEDARLTYNDVVALATGMVSAEKAVMASEIVYALTNEKGRTRAERANESYYKGIRETPYAPMVKLADRLANLTYSARRQPKPGRSMLDVYAAEMPHFISSITSPLAATDPRFGLPEAMLEEIDNLLRR